VVDNKTILLDAKPENKTFNYDYVVDENSSQEEVFYKIAKPIVNSCLEGYNGTIFAYGQTGSGKTYTIQGPGFDDVSIQEQVEEDKGIIPRAFECIFNHLESLAEEETGESKVEYLVRTSYLEIYNEQIMDLLNPASHSLYIREDINKGVYVQGLIEEVNNSAHDMLKILKIGATRRHTGSTLMNKESSRSHSVLSTTIESKVIRDGLFNI
jgi:kinesin family member 15